MPSSLEFGQTPNGIPFVRGGSGPRHALILLGASSLFRPLGASEGQRYARTFDRLLPRDYRYTIMGYADHPPAGHSLDSIVEAVAATIEAEPTHPVTLIGISFGGFVALRLAARRPELVERLVLLVSAHRFSAEGRLRMDQQRQSLRAGDLYGLIVANAALFRRRWVNWLVRLKLRKDRSTLAARLHDSQAILRSYERLFSEDLDVLQQDAREVKAQSLVIGGTADQFFDRQTFEETARLIPHGQLALVRGETHMLPVENQGAVARALRSFLAEPSSLTAASLSARR
jgi:pimeloyl-ACP methyl ester carboxylesterase